ncbi:MAG: hypothetical protein JO061_02690 [Acidobacteriaceae bacterium]|nr:hypothetical protein [Acidobacteriaceae bacterium]
MLSFIRRTCAASILSIGILVTSASAQSSGHKLYLDPSMPGDLHPFIAAELVKQHVPATLVTDESQAECTIKAVAINDRSLWHDAFVYDKDKIEGTLEVVDLSKHEIVWAGAAGDRSLFFNPLRRSGNRKVAARIVKQLKKAGTVGGCLVSTDPFK